MELFELTSHELREKLEKKEITVIEVTKAYLDRIRQVDSQVKAYITVLEEKALEKAKEVQTLYDNGEELGPLAGIPIAIKDNICTKGIKTTCASKMLEEFIPPYNATVVEKLEKENAIILGKLNMDEFAMGTTTEHSYFFPTRNPWDLEKSPGGSSGGAAAAIAGNLATITLGSDTGGSIREPASWTGTVGLKPTYGMVSRYGLIAFASSLDQIGPVSKDVTDAAIMLNIISGHDEHDSTSINIEKIDYTKALINNVKGLKIGIPKEYMGEGIDKEVKESISEVAEKYKELGAVVEEFSFGEAVEYSLAAYYIIACAEASSNLGRFDGIRYGYRTKNYTNLKELYKNSRSEGFGKEVKRRIILGTYVLSSGYYDAYYKKAQKVRTLVKQAFEQAFKKYDVLLTPVVPNTAFKIGEKVSDPLQMYMADVCTVPINITGVPAVSVPCGVDKSGMPIGMQLIAKHFNEQTLFRAAYTYEQNTNFKDKYKPKI